VSAASASAAAAPAPTSVGLGLNWPRFGRPSPLGSAHNTPSASLRVERLERVRAEQPLPLDAGRIRPRQRAQELWLRTYYYAAALNGNGRPSLLRPPRASLARSLSRSHVFATNFRLSRRGSPRAALRTADARRTNGRPRGKSQRGTLALSLHRLSLSRPPRSLSPSKVADEKAAGSFCIRCSAQRRESRVTLARCRRTTLLRPPLVLVRPRLSLAPRHSWHSSRPTKATWQAALRPPAPKGNLLHLFAPNRLISASQRRPASACLRRNWLPAAEPALLLPFLGLAQARTSNS
jgi:hypothetical protein